MEDVLGALGRPSPGAVYRPRSAFVRLHNDSDRAATMLGWRPRVGIRRVQPARELAGAGASLG